MADHFNRQLRFGRAAQDRRGIGDRRIQREQDFPVVEGTRLNGRAGVGQLVVNRARKSEGRQQLGLAFLTKPGGLLVVLTARDNRPANVEAATAMPAAIASSAMTRTDLRKLAISFSPFFLLHAKSDWDLNRQNCSGRSLQTKRESTGTPAPRGR